MLWNRLHVLPIEEILGKVDVFHSSDWAEPPASCFKVTTIHDMAPLIMPEYTPQKIVNVHKRKFEWIKKDVDRVIVPSKSTKNDAVRLGIKSEKIRVIPEALRSDFSKSSKEAVDKVKKKYKIEGRYALSVGTNPRKNIKRIAEAFNKVSPDVGLSNLAVVGEANQEINKSVVFLGKVDQKDLKALYSGAELLIFTSLYEGFGLPILEAFACGCPVLTSNISSMPEVAGDAGVLINPLSTDEIADGIVKTLRDSEKLIQKGKKRVKSFSWEETAKKTMEVYRESRS
jgi:glycosyltransferase involved in cell wall biosynthesis